MNTRCKFRCETKTEHNGDMKSYTFAAVTNGSDENKDFWKWTPSGKLEFQCLNSNVNFIPGKEYYLDITPIE